MCFDLLLDFKQNWWFEIKGRSSMLHHVSGAQCYLHFCEIYVNLVWHSYLFLLNINLPESESESE